jgi:hypothetical protein
MQRLIRNQASSLHGINSNDILGNQDMSPSITFLV